MNAKGPSFIYFMRPIGMLGPVKIGYSEVPALRLATYAAWSPFPLEIVAQRPGDYHLEQRIHGRFIDSHSHLEWFKPTADIIKTMQALEAGQSIEEAIDFSGASVKSLRSKWPVRKPWPLERRVHMSWFHKTRHALERANALKPGLDFRRPPDIDDMIYSILEGVILTPEQELRIQQLISDPLSYAIPWRVKYALRAA